MSTASPVRRLVVVGASLAGVRAVEAARKAGFDGSITLIGAEHHAPYDRPPLSKAYLEDPSVIAPSLVTSDYLADHLDVELLLGRPATALNPTDKTVVVGDLTVRYDSLIIATGSEPIPLPHTSATPGGVHFLRTVDDATAIRNHLSPGANVVVVGAGFIGSEVASSARKRGAHVTMVEAQSTPLARAVGVMGADVARLHERHGTRLLCATSVTRIVGHGRVDHVVLSDGQQIQADVVVVGIGVRPAVGWLRSCGLQLDNGILCDATLQTSQPGVYAAGDVANWTNPLYKCRQRMENWTAAAEQGAHAARNALHPDAATPFATVPYFWSDWYDTRIQFVGTADGADEVVVVDGEPHQSHRWIALYRRNTTLIGALTVNGQADIMKYRAKIRQGTTWRDALDFAEQRRIKRSLAQADKQAADAHGR